MEYDTSYWCCVGASINTGNIVGIRTVCTVHCIHVYRDSRHSSGMCKQCMFMPSELHTSGLRLCSPGVPEATWLQFPGIAERWLLFRITVNFHWPQNHQMCSLRIIRCAPCWSVQWTIVPHCIPCHCHQTCVRNLMPTHSQVRGSMQGSCRMRWSVWKATVC